MDEMHEMHETLFYACDNYNAQDLSQVRKADLTVRGLVLG